MRRTVVLLCLTSVALTPLGLAAPGAASAATSTCARYAATAGSDANAGTAASPYRSLQKLVAVLQPGQTGCLTGDVYEANEGNGIFRTSQGTATQPVTVTGTAKVRGWLLADTAAHDVVVRGLTFLGTPTDATGKPVAPKSTLINLLGDRITLRGNDITNPFGICVNAGKIDAFQRTDAGEPSDDIVIEGNRVHGCGMSPTLVWSDSDSGAHGIYLVNTRRARVVENLVYDNRYRGFQQWPTGSGTLVANNLFLRNATQVNVGSALTEGYPWWSTGTTVRDNVMVAKTSYRTEKNQASVAFNYPQGSPTYGNTVTGNCISPDTAMIAGFGYTASDNTAATAVLDAQLRLTAASPCQGKGPRSIQPGRSVTSGSAACSPGRVLSSAPSAASSPVADWLWFRADLYRWTGTAWVAQDRTQPWLFSRVADALGPWTRWSDRLAVGGVAFTGLADGYYAVVQTVVWNADGATTSTLQGSWCRI